MGPCGVPASAPGRIVMRMELAEFLALRTGRIDGWQFEHSVVELGLVHVPSGRLEACDPFAGLGDGLVFAVPPGSYPVRITVADVSPEQDGSHPRETYLSVVLADGEVASVAEIVPEGRDPLPAGSAQAYGIPVDGGAVGFVDREAAERYWETPEAEEQENAFVWPDEIESPDNLREGSATIDLAGSTHGENLVMTGSGWGDGLYVVLGSYDATGTLLGLHIDLEVDERSGEDDAEGAEASEHPAPAHRDNSPGFFTRLFGRGRR